MQTINILIVNQSVINLCSSFFTLITAAVVVDGAHMHHDSIYDQFVCRIWISRSILWSFLVMSTYGLLLIALERYTAVIYSIWYNVRIQHYLLYALRSVQSNRSYTKTPPCIPRSRYIEYHPRLG